MGRVQKIVKPFDTYGIYTNGAHSAGLDREFAEQTEAVAYRMCGTVRHFGCQTNLIASVTTAATWTAFGSYGSAIDKGIPWYVTPGFTKIRGVIRLLAHSRQTVMVRLRTDDLLDTVAEALGQPSTAKPLAQRQMDRSRSRDSSFWSAPGFMMGLYECDVTPTLPASRRVTVHIDIYMPGITGSTDVYLSDLVLFDMPSEEAGVG